MIFLCSRRYDDNRCRIMKTLFCIHRSVASILDLWSTKYKDMFFVDIKELAQAKTPYELYEFTVSNNKFFQITLIIFIRNFTHSICVDVKSIPPRGCSRTNGMVRYIKFYCGPVDVGFCLM